MKMTNLCTLDAPEVFKIFNYIKKFAPEEMDKKEFALTHIKDFFDHMDMTQEVELYSLLENEDYSGVTEFIKKYPTMPVNLDGDSKPKAQNGYEAKAIALEASYAMALDAPTSTKMKQIIDARELGCLKTVKEYSYNFEKFKLQQAYGSNNMIKSLDLYEEQLKDYPDCIRFLALVLEYFRMHPKHTIFLEYVFYYLDVIRLDTDNKTPLKDKYLDTIRKMLEYHDRSKKS